MQIKTKLTIQFTAVVAPILMVSFFVIYYSSSVYRKNEFYFRLVNKAHTTVEMLTKVEQVDFDLLKEIDKARKDHLPFESVAVFNYLNQEIFNNNDSAHFKVSKSLFDKIRLNNEVRFSEDGYEIIGFSYNDSLNRLVVLAKAKDIFGRNLLNNLRNTLVLLFVLIIGVVIVAGRIYSNRALQPISEVINEAEKLSHISLSNRLNESKSKDEIDRLIKTINSLLERIEDAFKVQKLFVASASHELKNPLTVITSQLEVSLINDRSNAEYKNTIKSVLDDIKDLNKLTIQLMELARVSYDSKDIPLRNIRIDEILWDVKSFFTHRYPSFQFDYQIISLPIDEEKLLFLGNETLLKTAMFNLAENACKFSENQKVIVTLQYVNDSIKINFVDYGRGIPKAEIPFVFEPFYRGHLNSEVKGYGIGLALVKQIILLHQAKISVSSEPGIGTNFEIIFNPKSS
jgi:signal transduction histidine kinase